MSTSSYRSLFAKEFVFVTGTEVDLAFPDYAGWTAVIRFPQTQAADAVALLSGDVIHTIGEQNFSWKELHEIQHSQTSTWRSKNFVFVRGADACKALSLFGHWRGTDLTLVFRHANASTKDVGVIWSGDMCMFSPRPGQEISDEEREEIDVAKKVIRADYVLEGEMD